MAFICSWSFRRGGKIRLRRVRADTDNLLAEVFAFQQPNQFAGGVLQSICDVLEVLDPAFSQPATHVGDEIGELGAVVTDDETAEGQPLDENISHEQWHSIRPNWQFGRVVVGDKA